MSVTSILSIALAPNTAGDAQKLARALPQMIAEEPTLHVRTASRPAT